MPVDSIEGPTVRLRGEVYRIDDEETAVVLEEEIEKILDVGEILISLASSSRTTTRLFPPATARSGGCLNRNREQNRRRMKLEALALARAGNTRSLSIPWTGDVDISVDQDPVFLPIPFRVPEKLSMNLQWSSLSNRT